MWYYKSYISEFFGNSCCDALPACVGAGVLRAFGCDRAASSVVNREVSLRAAGE
jgi:hypothetical protein